MRISELQTLKLKHLEELDGLPVHIESVAGKIILKGCY